MESKGVYRTLLGVMATQADNAPQRGDATKKRGESPFESRSQASNKDSISTRSRGELIYENPLA